MTRRLAPRLGHMNEDIVHNVLGGAGLPEQHHRQLEQIVLVLLVDPLERLGAAVLESPDQVPFFQHPGLPRRALFSHVIHQSLPLPYKKRPYFSRPWRIDCFATLARPFSAHLCHYESLRGRCQEETPSWALGATPQRSLSVSSARDGARSNKFGRATRTNGRLLGVRHGADHPSDPEPIAMRVIHAAGRRWGLPGRRGWPGTGRRGCRWSC